MPITGSPSFLESAESRETTGSPAKLLTVCSLPLFIFFLLRVAFTAETADFLEFRENLKPLS